MESIGTDVSLHFDSENPGVKVSSNMGEEWDTTTQSAIAHGVLLTLTALAAEGMHDILDNPKFEHCIKCALDRVPSLSVILESGE